MNRQHGPCTDTVAHRPAADRAAQVVRAARNRACVRTMLREKCPGFAAALDAAVRELSAELAARE